MSSYDGPIVLLAVAALAAVVLVVLLAWWLLRPHELGNDRRLLDNVLVSSMPTQSVLFEEEKEQEE